MGAVYDSRMIADRTPPSHARYDPDDPRALRVHRQPPVRDVPYVPTDEPVVAAMLRFAGVGPRDVVYDLGCGDGRIVTAAAKLYGARGVGVDIDPQRIAEARERAAKARVAHLATFHCQSFFDTDFRDATVVMLYLLPAINARLRPRLLSDLKPGTRIVANYFGMGDWQPDMQAHAHHRVLHQWLVPSRVSGTWNCLIDLGPRNRKRMTLRLTNRYQVVHGTAQLTRHPVPIADGRLFGDRLTFKLTGLHPRGFPLRFSCQISGNTLRGSCHSDPIEQASIAWGGLKRG
jgi:SAM-dependent methyltransferase